MNNCTFMGYVNKDESFTIKCAYKLNLFVQNCKRCIILVISQKITNFLANNYFLNNIFSAHLFLLSPHLLNPGKTRPPSSRDPDRAPRFPAFSRLATRNRSSRATTETSAPAAPRISRRVSCGDVPEGGYLTYRAIRGCKFMQIRESAKRKFAAAPVRRRPRDVTVKGRSKSAPRGSSKIAGVERKEGAGPPLKNGAVFSIFLAVRRGGSRGGRGRIFRDSSEAKWKEWGGFLVIKKFWF